MDKRELATVVSHRTNVCRKDCETVISGAIEAIKEAVARDESVRIQGFGSFYQKKVPARVFQHPRTKMRFEKPSRVIPGFQVSPTFTKELASKVGGPVEH